MHRGNFEGPISQMMAFTPLRKMTEIHLNCIARCFQTGFHQNLNRVLKDKTERKSAIAKLCILPSTLNL